MYDKQTDLDERYLKAAYYKSFRGNKIVFALHSIIQGIKSDTLILSHVNLLLFARIIKIFTPEIRVILIAHGIEVWQPLAGWKKKFLQKQVEIWAVSRFTALKLTEVQHIPSAHIRILNNCLDPFFEIPGQFIKPAALVERYGLKADQPVLFTLTRLSSKEAYKGYDRVLHALTQLDERFLGIQYLIGGKADADEQQRVSALIRQLKLEERVQLIGFVPDEELSLHYQLGDLFIMPSTQEGFGIAFIEAAACGVKVIGGNKDGSTDALLDGKMGALIDPENVQAIADAIENQLSINRQPQEIQELCLSNFGYIHYLKGVQNSFIKLFKTPPAKNYYLS